jgi:putative transposase
MNAPKCRTEDYINFLVAAPRVVSGTEAARVQPERPDPPAHDAFTRLLHRREPNPATLWEEEAPQVPGGQGVLVLDDSPWTSPTPGRSAC